MTLRKRRNRLAARILGAAAAGTLAILAVTTGLPESSTQGASPELVVDEAPAMPLRISTTRLPMRFWLKRTLS